MGTNCWLLTDEASCKTAVIDPGFLSERLTDAIQAAGKIDKILLTHGHFDHIGAADALRRSTGAPIYVMEQDAPFLKDPELNLSGMMGEPLAPFTADLLLKDGDTISLGGIKLQTIHTPGHTIGSCCYLTDGVIFSGDTVFCGSVGRTDFPTGSGSTLLASVKRLAALEGDYQIFPGHGEPTSLESERKSNPYFAMRDNTYDFDY